MSDPRTLGLREAVTMLQTLAGAWPEDVFGPDLSGDEWIQVRSAGIPTERIASACYRHALRVLHKDLLAAIADYEEDDL